MKKYRFMIIIFIVDAICMIIELVASRLLSPYFGTSNIVWTSVIGMILLSSSIGNFLGGKLADKDTNEALLKVVLLIDAIIIFIIPFYQRALIYSISKVITDNKVGAILSTSLTFFVPSLLMGIINPIIFKLNIKDINNVGNSIGRITSIATIGSIFGTFLGGFVLVPNIGSTNILFILAIIITLLIPLVDFNIKQKYTIGTCLIIVLSLICLFKFNTMNILNGQKVLSGDISDSEVSFDTQYCRVIIKNDRKEIGNVRTLNMDSGYQSATFIDDYRKFELVYPYTDAYNEMFKANIDIKNVLMIGGAGYSYPKYYISHYQDKKMDVVEIDEDIVKIAKEYFYLDELIEKYDKDNERLNLITDDGRIYLNKTKEKYDAILNDAFSGKTPAKTLTTIECVQKIKESLNPNGVYMTNILNSLEGEDSLFLRAEVNTLKQVFKNVYLIRVEPEIEVDNIQNIMVVASDGEINYKNIYDIKLDSNEMVLTDDYCPIEKIDHIDKI